jgi:polo-like kinase 1
MNIAPVGRVGPVDVSQSCPRTLTHKGVRLERLHLLGKGGFAKVFAFRNVDQADALLAVKVVDKRALAKSSSGLRRIAQEIAIHRTLSFPHIVALRDYFEDDANVYMAMDACDGDTVYEFVKRRLHRRVSELECKRFMFQTALAVAYLHQRGVVHRDLKLGNLFLHNNSIRVGDFGLATSVARGQPLRTVCGTPNYLAPEIIQADAGRGYSFEVDVWALGVCTFALLVGVPPFETTSVAETYRRIQANEYDPSPLGAEARALVRRLLAPSPSARPTAAALRDEPFFRPLNAAPRLDVPTQVVDDPAARSPLHAIVASNKPATPTKRIAVIASGAEPPLVERWVDYRHKYGVAFALESGSFQAVFNDLSRIVLLGDDVRYFDEAPAPAVACTVDEYPQRLHKKVTLIKFFRQHLREAGARAEADGRTRCDELVSVLQCDLGKQSTVFHLSDGTVEVHLPADAVRLRIAANRRVAVLQSESSATSSTTTTTTVQIDSKSAPFASLPPRVQAALVAKH